MKEIKFVDNPQSYNPINAFVAHLSDMNNKDELFNQLSDKLQLPSYFGFNWDALSDCIRDFHWIDQIGIALVHDDFPALDEKTMTTYLQILLEAIENWKDEDEHYFEIVFPKQV